jgi:hypothetical protein
VSATSCETTSALFATTGLPKPTASSISTFTLESRKSFAVSDRATVAEIREILGLLEQALGQSDLLPVFRKEWEAISR